MAAVTPKTWGAEHPTALLLSPPVLRGGVGGVGARGFSLSFRGFGFECFARVSSLRFVCLFALFQMICVMFVCCAVAWHGCGSGVRRRMAAIRAACSCRSLVVLALWQGRLRAWRLEGEWSSPATTWSTSVACRSHAAACHRPSGPTVPALHGGVLGGGAWMGARPWHRWPAALSVSRLSCFQFLGSLARLVLLSHAMPPPYPGTPCTRGAGSRGVGSGLCRGGRLVRTRVAWLVGDVEAPGAVEVSGGFMRGRVRR